MNRMVHGMDRRLCTTALESFVLKGVAMPMRSGRAIALNRPARATMQGVNLSRQQFGDSGFLRVIGPMMLVVLVLALLWAGMSFLVDDLFNAVPLQEIEAVQG